MRRKIIKKDKKRIIQRPEKKNRIIPDAAAGYFSGRVPPVTFRSLSLTPSSHSILS